MAKLQKNNLRYWRRRIGERIASYYDGYVGKLIAADRKNSKYTNDIWLTIIEDDGLVTENNAIWCTFDTPDERWVHRDILKK